MKPAPTNTKHGPNTGNSNLSHNSSDNSAQGDTIDMAVSTREGDRLKRQVRELLIGLQLLGAEHRVTRELAAILHPRLPTEMDLYAADQVYQPLGPGGLRPGRRAVPLSGRPSWRRRSSTPRTWRRRVGLPGIACARAPIWRPAVSRSRSCSNEPTPRWGGFPVDEPEVGRVFPPALIGAS
jgi:hypothetical protein